MLDEQSKNKSKARVLPLHPLGGFAWRMRRGLGSWRDHARTYSGLKPSQMRIIGAPE